MTSRHFIEWVKRVMASRGRRINKRKHRRLGPKQLSVFLRKERRRKMAEGHEPWVPRVHLRLEGGLPMHAPFYRGGGWGLTKHGSHMPIPEPSWAAEMADGHLSVRWVADYDGKAL